MLTRESFRLRFLGLMCILTFISAIILGMLLGTGGNFELDLTRTEFVAMEERGIPEFIRATQTSDVIQTQLAEIQPTQTYIADTKATLGAKIYPTQDK